MFQPQVKFEFVRRYCPPRDGWCVYVDIDASELGKAGSQNLGVVAGMMRKRMQEDGVTAVAELTALGVQVGGPRKVWRAQNNLPEIKGDRDIIAFHSGSRRCIIAEVEGASSGQPEQKLYKAIGQLVIAVSETHLADWETHFILVAQGEKMGRHTKRASALAKLGVSALVLSPESMIADQWVIGSAPL